MFRALNQPSRRLALVAGQSKSVHQPLRNYATRQKGAVNPLKIAFQKDDDDEEVRYRTQKNPEIPNVQRLTVRWNKMDAGQQDDIIAYLEDRMRGDWKQLTDDEKRAIQYIYFGAWGPRGEAKDHVGVYGQFARIAAVAVAGVLSYKALQTYKKSQTEDK